MLEHSRNWRCYNIPEAQNSMEEGRGRVAVNEAAYRKSHSLLRAWGFLPEIFTLYWKKQAAIGKI